MMERKTLHFKGKGIEYAAVARGRAAETSMKKVQSIAIILVSAALFWAPAAHALILTTWKLPSNKKALEAEYAANTNVVTVLEMNRSVDGDTVTLLYRKGGKLSAQSFNEEEFVSKMRLVKGALGGGGVRSAATVPVSAEDGPGYYKDGGGQFASSWVGGESRGEGAWGGAWRHLGGSETYQAGFTSGGKMSLTMKDEEGETVVGRDMAVPLAEGEFSVDALLDAGDSFRGFAVYDDGKELIRWGIGADLALQQTGFGYSLDQGQSYTFFESDLPGGNVLDTYSMTWAQLNGGDSGLEFTLLGNYWDGPVTVPVLGATAVSTVALFAVADTYDFNNEIVFTSVRVSGTPVRAVPEPGTMGLLAAGAALAVAGRRERKGKREGK